jgi:hypothetical protein
MNPMQPEEEELDPRRQVLADLTKWAQLGEADGMRERYGKPPRPADPLEVGNLMPSEDEQLLPEEGMGGGMASPDDPELPGSIPGVEPTEDDEPPAPGAEGEELDEEKLMRALAAMGG